MPNYEDPYGIERGVNNFLNAFYMARQARDEKRYKKRDARVAAIQAQIQTINQRMQDKYIPGNQKAILAERAATLVEDLEETLNDGKPVKPEKGIQRISDVIRQTYKAQLEQELPVEDFGTKGKVEDTSAQGINGLDVIKKVPKTMGDVSEFQLEQGLEKEKFRKQLEILKENKRLSAEMGEDQRKISKGEGDFIDPDTKELYHRSYNSETNSYEFQDKFGKTLTTDELKNIKLQDVRTFNIGVKAGFDLGKKVNQMVLALAFEKGLIQSPEQLKDLPPSTIAELGQEAGKITVDKEKALTKLLELRGIQTTQIITGNQPPTPTTKENEKDEELNSLSSINKDLSSARLKLGELQTARNNISVQIENRMQQIQKEVDKEFADKEGEVAMAAKDARLNAAKTSDGELIALQQKLQDKNKEVNDFLGTEYKRIEDDATRRGYKVDKDDKGIIKGIESGSTKKNVADTGYSNLSKENLDLVTNTILSSKDLAITTDVKSSNGIYMSQLLSQINEGIYQATVKKGYDLTPEEIQKLVSAALKQLARKGYKNIIK